MKYCQARDKHWLNKHIKNADAPVWSLQRIQSQYQRIFEMNMHSFWKFFDTLSSDKRIAKYYWIDCTNCDTEWLMMLRFVGHNQQNSRVKEDQRKKNQQGMGNPTAVQSHTASSLNVERERTSWEFYWIVMHRSGKADSMYDVETCVAMIYFHGTTYQLGKDCTFHMHSIFFSHCNKLQGCVPISCTHQTTF